MYKACGTVSPNQISNAFLELKVTEDQTIASTMQQTTAATEYKDFEPQVDWIDAETANFLVPGFTRDQMRVQVSSWGKLLVSGQRRLDGNKVSRFRKELQIPDDCDVNGISAKFMAGDVLQIRLPKVATAPSAGEKYPQEPKAREDEKPAAAGNKLESEGSGLGEKFGGAGRLGMVAEKRRTAVTFVLAALVVVGALAVGYLSGRLDQAVRDGWKLVHRG